MRLDGYIIRGSLREQRVSDEASPRRLDHRRQFGEVGSYSSPSSAIVPIGKNAVISEATPAVARNIGFGDT
jgi:hypothetical protein